MKISDLCEQWNINDPINTLSSPSDQYDKIFIKLLARIEDIYNANAITRHEAEIIIWFDKSLIALTSSWDDIGIIKQLLKDA